MRIIDARFVDILANVAVTCRGTQRFVLGKKGVS